MSIYRRANGAYHVAPTTAIKKLFIEIINEKILNLMDLECVDIQCIGADFRVSNAVIKDIKTNQVIIANIKGTYPELSLWANDRQIGSDVSFPPIPTVSVRPVDPYERKLAARKKAPVIPELNISEENEFSVDVNNLNTSEEEINSEEEIIVVDEIPVTEPEILKSDFKKQKGKKK